MYLNQRKQKIIIIINIIIIIIGLLKHIQTLQLQAELSLKYKDSYKKIEI